MDTALAQCADSRAHCQLPTALGPYVHFMPEPHGLHLYNRKIFPTQNLLRRIKGVKCKLFTGSLVPNKH